MPVVKPKVTVLTPTFNRSESLNRVYKSLLNQSYKEFIWLIVDDGSTDDTKEVVDTWIKEGRIRIHYHYKENGGKHTAMDWAFSNVGTKYIIDLDSDDELTEDAVEVFMRYWNQIEKQGLEKEIADVRSNVIDDGIEDIVIYGEYEDLTYYEQVYTRKIRKESIGCFNTEKLKKHGIMAPFLFEDLVSFVVEGVRWFRIGKVYKTRYIHENLRVYHTDSSDGLMNEQRVVNSQNKINKLVSLYLMLNENMMELMNNRGAFIRFCFVLNNNYLKCFFEIPFIKYWKNLSPQLLVISMLIMPFSILGIFTQKTLKLIGYE